MAARNQAPGIPLLVIAGPTAVGKSALALQLAELLKTEIISADSVQVYKYMNIGTAKPTADEQRLVRHHLIDLIDPNQSFSVADYQKAANKKINYLWSVKKLPLMVGGTGLYIRAVSTAYAFGNTGADPEIRDNYEKEAAVHGLNNLYEKLKELDPAAAGIIHPNDRRRIIRALEVYRLEGRQISEQITRTKQGETPFNSLIFGLTLERCTLYERIEKRVDKMVEDGFLEEVRYLRAKGFVNTDPGLQTLGYRQLYTYLDGKAGWEETITAIKKETRNLAKRQLTWFRRETGITWIDLSSISSIKDIAENICKIAKDFVP